MALTPWTTRMASPARAIGHAATCRWARQATARIGASRGRLRGSAGQPTRARAGRSRASTCDMADWADNLFGEAAPDNHTYKVKFGAPHVVDLGRELEHTPAGDSEPYMYVVGHGANATYSPTSWMQVGDASHPEAVVVLPCPPLVKSLGRAAHRGASNQQVAVGRVCSNLSGNRPHRSTWPA